MNCFHLCTGSLVHSSCGNCSSSPRFEWCLLPTAVFRSPHRCSMGFSYWLIAGHFRTVQCFLFRTIFGCFLKCVWGRCPATRPVTFDGDPSNTGLNIVIQNASLLISWFRDAMHTFKASSARGSTATPKHHWTSSMFEWREGVLFFEGFILFSVNLEMMSFTKKL